MSDKKPNQTSIRVDNGGGKESIVNIDAPSNSKKPKTQYSKSAVNSAPSTADPSTPRPDIVQITSNAGVQKKRGFGAKLKNVFTGEDAKSVGHYLLFDVIIPETKQLVFDTGRQGLERLLFGTSSPRANSRGNVGREPVTPYSRISTSRTSSLGNGGRQLSEQHRAVHNFETIVVDSQVEATQVLDHLQDLIEKYGSARVEDFYTMVGLTPDYTDQNWGWFSIANSGVRPARGGGYMIILPATEIIE